MDEEYRLIAIVLSKSNSKTFDEAKYEWEVVDYYIHSDETCICGKQHIKHCHIIKHKETNEILNPVGSECVKRFNNYQMNNQANILTYKYNIFNNKGKKHDGETYEHICKNDPNYVRFLGANAYKKKYLKLFAYFTYVTSLT